MSTEEKNLLLYKVWVTDDVRKDEPNTECVTVRAKSPNDAMHRILKSRPAYTGVCYSGMADEW